MNKKNKESDNLIYDSIEDVVCDHNNIEDNKFSDHENTKFGITIFENTKFGKVRTTVVNGEPVLVGKDVASILGYTNTRKAIRDHVDSEDKCEIQLSDIQQGNESFLSNVKGSKILVINESGLYSLILRSNLPLAKEFKKWVTKEVLPSIRKHGAYMTNDTLEQALASPDFLIQLATQLKEEKQKRIAAEVKSGLLEMENAELKPKAEILERIAGTKGFVTMSQTAKILQLPYGRNTLFQKLKEKGIFFKNCNEPKQSYIQQGYFKLKVTHINNEIEGELSVITSLVTKKGLEFLARQFINEVK